MTTLTSFFAMPLNLNSFPRRPFDITVSWWNEPEGTRCWFSVYFYAPLSVGPSPQIQWQWARSLAEGVPAFLSSQGCQAEGHLSAPSFAYSVSESSEAFSLEEADPLWKLSSYYELGEAPSERTLDFCNRWVNQELRSKGIAVVEAFMRSPDDFYDEAIQGLFQQRLSALAQRDELERGVGVGDPPAGLKALGSI